jgi:hypothetical protein
MMYRFMCPKFNGHDLVWMATMLESVPDIIPSSLKGSVETLCNFISYSYVLMFQHLADILLGLVMVI